MALTPDMQTMVANVEDMKARGPVHVARDPTGGPNKPTAVKTYTEQLADRVATLEAQVAALVAKVG